MWKKHETDATNQMQLFNIPKVLKEPIFKKTTFPVKISLQSLSNKYSVRFLKNFYFKEKMFKELCLNTGVVSVQRNSLSRALRSLI